MIEGKRRSRKSLSIFFILLLEKYIDGQAATGKREREQDARLREERGQKHKKWRRRMSSLWHAHGDTDAGEHCLIRLDP